MANRSRPLQIIPYIGNTPAGLSTAADVVWLDEVLYVKKGPIARLAMPLSQELGKTIRKPELI